MSVVNDDPYAYLRNPYFTGHEFGDYSAFYITIAFCTIFGFFLCMLNVIFGCCSSHKDYWQDSNTGNRWILPVWSKTPHLQPALDYTEIDKEWLPTVEIIEPDYDEHIPQNYLELQKRESEI